MAYVWGINLTLVLLLGFKIYNSIAMNLLSLRIFGLHQKTIPVQILQ